MNTATKFTDPRSRLDFEPALLPNARPPKGVLPGADVDPRTLQFLFCYYEINCCMKRLAALANDPNSIERPPLVARWKELVSARRDMEAEGLRNGFLTSVIMKELVVTDVQITRVPPHSQQLLTSFSVVLEFEPELCAE